jgi:cobalt-precorrin-5B (C1)-methyltransferase
MSAHRDGYPRSGYSSGACAAAAAKAAVILLCGAPPPETVEIALPDGSLVVFPVVSCHWEGAMAQAAIRKDAGDDPDVTHGAYIVAKVKFHDSHEVEFAAGEGVGTVTKPGLSVAPGGPAINPVPRRMIAEAVRAITPHGVRVTISIPGGRELAARTFNPRLGIVDGLSVLGTTGRVRPFSTPALQAALQCALAVAAAGGVTAPVLVPGNIGERAARQHLRVTAEQVIQVSNHWGFMLDQAARSAFVRLLALGHPGKLAKLVDGDWDTHSSHSGPAVPAVARVAATVLDAPLPQSPTVEGMFSGLAVPQRALLANALAAAIRRAILGRIGPQKTAAVVLINMSGEFLGSDGDLKPWQ